MMSLLIMQDTTGIPEIVATFQEDAKGIILTNTGNARAEKIHVTLVPGNMNLIFPPWMWIQSMNIPLAQWLQEIKIVITYTNENRRLFSSSKKLSVFDEEPIS